MAKLTAHEKSFTEGFVCALATVLKLDGCTKGAQDAWQTSGIKLDELKSCNVPQSDIDMIIKFHSDLN